MDDKISRMQDAMADSLQSLQETAHRKNNPAEYMLKRISTQIESFQRAIEDDVEVGVHVVGSGSVAPFRLRSMRVSNPDILIFNGIDDAGNSVRLVQHYSQASILLVAVPKLKEKPFRIGFTNAGAED